MIGGGLPGCTPPAWAARADARRRARAAPAAARRRRAGGRRRGARARIPRGGRARRSCSSSEPPVQTGSEACSPVPVSGAWSPCAASAIHGLQAPPRARTRTSTCPLPRTPIRSKRRAGEHAARARAVEVGGRDRQAEAARPRLRAASAGRRAERLEQRSEPGGRAERERAPAGDRRTPHRAERSLGRRAGNVCTISCSNASPQETRRPATGLRRRARSGSRSRQLVTGRYAATGSGAPPASAAGVAAHSAPSQRSP